MKRRFLLHASVLLMRAHPKCTMTTPRVATCVSTTGNNVWTDRPGDSAPNVAPLESLRSTLCFVALFITLQVLIILMALELFGNTLFIPPRSFAAHTNILNLLYKQMCYSADSGSSAADNRERGWQQTQRLLPPLLSSLCSLFGFTLRHCSGVWSSLCCLLWGPQWIFCTNQKS